MNIQVLTETFEEEVEVRNLCEHENYTTSVETEETYDPWQDKLTTTEYNVYTCKCGKEWQDEN
jgi:hypothetical protein